MHRQEFDVDMFEKKHPDFFGALFAVTDENQVTHIPTMKQYREVQ